jgi:hypothetical protein
LKGKHGGASVSLAAIDLKRVLGQAIESLPPDALFTMIAPKERLFSHHITYLDSASKWTVLQATHLRWELCRFSRTWPK